jgi:hypothetical protein
MRFKPHNSRRKRIGRSPESIRTVHFWSTGGRDLSHFVNLGIVSCEVEAFALQNIKSRDRDVI